MSNSLDPDQDRRCVGPDLGPNHAQIKELLSGGGEGGGRGGGPGQSDKKKL